jgi:hypothetical protein
MIIDLLQFRPAYPGEGLARRSPGDDVEGCNDRPQLQLVCQSLRCRQDVPRPAMLLETIVKVDAVRAGSIGVVFDGRHDVEPRRLQAEQQPPTARKEIKHPRPSASLQTHNLLPDWLGSHRSLAVSVPGGRNRNPVCRHISSTASRWCSGIAHAVTMLLVFVRA